MTDDKRAPAPQAPVGNRTSAPVAPGPAPAAPSPAPAAPSPAPAAPGPAPTAPRPPTEPRSATEPRRAAAATHDPSDVDPYKVRRVTIPPAMRVQMIDWWKNRRHENLPKDTVPPDPKLPDEPTPKRGVEPDTIRNFPPPRATPDSVTPVGVPTVPMKSLRGVAVGIAVVAAALLILVILVRRHQPPRVAEPASAMSGAAPALTRELVPAAPASITASPAASPALSTASPPVAHELGERPNPMGTASMSARPVHVAPPLAPRAAPRAKSRGAVAEPRRPADAAQPATNQNSTQDPFAKPFFPPAK